MKNEDLISDDLLKHGTFVRGLARRLTCNPADADDIEQDLWLAAYRSPGLLKHKSIRAWFTTVAKNLLTKGSHQPTPSFPDNSHDELPDTGKSRNEVAIKLVFQGVFALPEIYKDPLLLYCVTTKDSACGRLANDWATPKPQLGTV